MLHIQEGTIQKETPDTIPEVIRALAAASATERVPEPKPIKWRMSRPEDEGEGMIVIIFEHGPTVMFTEEQVTPRIAVMKKAKPVKIDRIAVMKKAKPVKIDMSDGVDKTEASTAGKALQARKQSKK